MSIKYFFLIISELRVCLYYNKYAQHFHLRRAAFPLGPFQPLDLAQKDFRLPASFFVLGFGAGAFSFEPVVLLYLLRF